MGQVGEGSVHQASCIYCVHDVFTKILVQNGSLEGHSEQTHPGYYKHPRRRKKEGDELCEPQLDCKVRSPLPSQDCCQDNRHPQVVRGQVTSVSPVKREDISQTERYSGQGGGWNDLLRGSHLEAQRVVPVGMRLVVEGHSPLGYVKQVGSFEVDAQ